MKKYLIVFAIISLLFTALANLNGQSAKSQKPGSTNKDGSKQEQSNENVFPENQNGTNINHNYSAELLEIIKIFLPEEGSDASTIDWQTGNEINSITWQKDHHSYNGFEMKLGSLKVNNSKWDINLNGSTGGTGAYNVSVGFGFASYGIGGGEIDCNESLELDYWISVQDLNYTLIKKDECYISEGGAFYEVSIPGKKKVWAWTSYSSGSKSGITGISFYFDKDEALKVDY